MGLLRMAARTAVVAGTATAVSGRVQRRQAARYDQQDAQQYEQQQQQQQQQPPPAAPAEDDATAQAPEPGAAPHAGRAHRRGVRGRQGQDPRNLTGPLGGPVRHVEAYSRLAGVYDEIVVDPCHDRWASFLHELWSADPDGVRSVLDLCCGTGLLAGELIARGYRVVGVDASDAMLALARERLGPEVALSRMTLPDLTVEGVFDAAVCTFDGFNYLDPGRAATDDGRGGPPASARRLARLRPPHRRDDGLHHRQPRRRG